MLEPPEHLRWWLQRRDDAIAGSQQLCPSGSASKGGRPQSLSRFWDDRPKASGGVLSGGHGWMAIAPGGSATGGWSLLSHSMQLLQHYSAHPPPGWLGVSAHPQHLRTRHPSHPADAIEGFAHDGLWSTAAAFAPQCHQEAPTQATAPAFKELGGHESPIVELPGLRQEPAQF